MLPGLNLTQSQPTTTMRAMQNTNSTAEVPIAHRTRNQLSAAAARAQSAANGVLVGQGWRIVWLDGAPSTGLTGLPPTLEEVKAAIPEQGIAVADLVRAFYPRVKGPGAFPFIAQIQEVAKQDPVTKLIFPKM